MYSVKVSNIWTKPDPQVSWSNGKIKAGCSATWFPSGGQCYDTQTWVVPTPNIGSTYSGTPWFAGSNHKTELNDVSYQVGRQEITLHQGSNTWNFGFCVAKGGGSVLFC